MARTKVLTTAKRIRRHLGLGYRQEQSALVADVAAPSVTFQVNPMPAGLRAGVVLGVDFELMRVVTADTATSMVTVLRGYLDTDPAVHTAGALVDVAPRFSLVDVLDAMQSELASWGQQLYRVEDQTLAVATSATTLELPGSWENMLGVISLVQQETGGLNTVWPQIDAKLIRGTPAGFSGAALSGALLRFVEPIRTGAVHVLVALAFDSTILADPTKDLTVDVLLSPGLIDVLELGTQRRLLMQAESSRTARSAQDEPRRAEETPVGASNPRDQFQFAIYTKRKSEEVARLRRRFPIRMM